MKRKLYATMMLGLLLMFLFAGSALAKTKSHTHKLGKADDSNMTCQHTWGRVQRCTVKGCKFTKTILMKKQHHFCIKDNSRKTCKKRWDTIMKCKTCDATIKINNPAASHSYVKGKCKYCGKKKK